MRTGTPLRSLFIVLGALVVFATVATLMHRRPVPAAGQAAAPTAPIAAIVTAPAPVAAPTAAADPRQPAARVPATPKPIAPAVRPGNAGLRAYIDPETGTFGAPSPEVLRAEAAEQGLQAVEETAQVVVLPNGAEMLIGGPPDYVVAQRDAKGKLVIRTVTDPRQVRAGGAPLTPQPVER